MITIRDLSIDFGGKPIFEEVNFFINEREKIGLIGRNGSGKSTFLKLLLGELKPSEGEVKIPAGYRIGHLQQHIKFTNQTIIDEVCSVLEPERDHEGWRGEQILLGLGFSLEDMMRDPSEFSGGFQVKINLAKVLLSEPDMLLLDEPTNYLDIYSIKWLTDFLKEWRGEMILITHDKSFMDAIITHTLLIHRNNFRKVEGNTSKLLDQIKNEEELHEKTRTREAKERAEVEAWNNRFRATASKASAVKSREKMLEKQGVKEKLTIIDDICFSFNYMPYGSKDDMLSATNLSFGYEEGRPLFSNLNFNIRKGEKWGIIGRNGNGKSTLLKALNGDIKLWSGDVKINPKTQIGYFGQTNISRLNENMSIYEELESVDPNLDQTKIRHTCANMLFKGGDAFKKIKVLSGGEKGRVMLGKIILSPENLLLLDEPTNHFDFQSSAVLLEAIKEFEGAAVIVTHDEHFLHEIVTKLIIFDNGKVTIFNGTYQDFLDKIGWQE